MEILAESLTTPDCFLHVLARKMTWTGTTRAIQNAEAGAEMLTRITLTVALLLPNGPTTFAGQDSQDREFRDWLMVQAREIDFDQISPHRAIYALLAIAESCAAMEQDALADQYFQRALSIDEKDKKGSHHFTLFAYAIDTEQMTLAEKIAKDSKSDALLDRWDLERFRRGDRDAIKDYPRGEMTFYNAIELANVFIELGDYDRAEEFVTDIEITEENDPKDVAGITLENIAKRYRENGDMENAKRYIDKAVAVAGNQFYTGYAINITHRSIHGVLTEDLDKFARRGVAYRGHMGRELVQLLVSELVRTGRFEEAKKTAVLLEKPEDVRSSLRNVAIEQARRGDMTAALKTVEQLEDAQARNAARLGIAEVLSEAGNSDTARKLADFVLSNMKTEIDEELERTYQRLAHLYGALRCQPQLEQLIAHANSPTLKADCVWNAIKGFADAEAKRRLK